TRKNRPSAGSRRNRSLSPEAPRGRHEDRRARYSALVRNPRRRPGGSHRRRIGSGRSAARAGPCPSRHDGREIRGDSEPPGAGRRKARPRRLRCRHRQRDGCCQGAGQRYHWATCRGRCLILAFARRVGDSAPQGASPMREIIFDTETTGLDSREDRIIEFGGIEMVNKFPTGRTFHQYINPEGRPVHPDALAVHGISDEQLADKPTFKEIASQLLDFLDGAVLIAHNANFDIGFLNAEFARLGVPPIDPSRVIDTLALAKRKHPMGPNSLDALCRRHGIDNSHRTKHGALLDSELLAEVYIELMGGKQATFSLDTKVEVTVTRTEIETVTVVRQRERPLAPRLTDADIAAHRKLVDTLGASAIWKEVEPDYREQIAAE